jgi:hypothetical protein
VSGVTMYAQEFADAGGSVAPPPPPPPSGPGPVDPGRGAVRGTDGQMWVLLPGTGGHYAALGGALSAAPATIEIPGGHLYLANGTDHHIWQRTDTIGWNLLSGAAYCIDNPGATVSGGSLRVACRGGDNGLWVAQTPLVGGGFGAANPTWVNYGGNLSSGPSVAVVGGQFAYFVAAPDRHVWWRTDSAWWGGTGWNCVGHPAVASYGSISYFACHGTDGQLWYAENGGGGWMGAQPAGGRLIDGVGISMSNGLASIFVEGADGAVWQSNVPFGRPAGGLGYDGGAITSGAAAG